MACLHTVSSEGKYVGPTPGPAIMATTGAPTDMPAFSLCKQKETQPPGAQDLFLEFTRPIYDQLTSGIRGFYNNY